MESIGIGRAGAPRSNSPGRGNVGTIVSAILATMRELGAAAESPWYFPCVSEYVYDGEWIADYRRLRVLAVKPA